MKSSCRGVGRALLGPNIERSGKSLHGKLLGGSFWSWELLVRHKLGTAKPGGVGWAQVKVQKGRDRRHKKKTIPLLQGFIWAQHKDRSGKHKGGQVGIRKNQVSIRKSQVCTRKSQAHKGRDLQHKEKYHPLHFEQNLTKAST